ncbi:MAG: peptidylprolyl isomerase [Rhodocyclaceae bacterium]|nr:peptidylprolyl isomerase [Rhodocyclaceae bacterium]
MRSFRLVATCIVLCLAAGAVLAQSRARAPVEVDRIVAIVNDEAITLHELEARLATVERQLRTQGTPMPSPDTMKHQLLERMITDRVQLQYAKETGLQVADGELDAALRRIADSNRLSLPDFKAALERDKIAWPKFREEIRGEMVISRLREREVDSRMSISEGEVDNFLANPKNADSGDVAVNLAHIVIRVPEQADPGQLMRLAARARQALDQIKHGEDFGKVAATFSDAPDGLSGGAMGLRPLDRLPTLYADTAQKMSAGEVSEILRSPAGFHIIKVIEKRGGAAIPHAIKQTHASHILIKINELVSESEGERKLIAIRERLEHGASFAELARLYSNDLSAAKGGDLGWLYQGDTVPEFERAMDALKIGEISQPVRSPFGWHLIVVHERRTDEASPERQRLLARQALRERKADEAYEDWLRQLRDRAYVEYRLEDR